jgi:type IV secretion system protein TrbG
MTRFIHSLHLVGLAALVIAEAALSVLAAYVMSPSEAQWAQIDTMYAEAEKHHEFICVYVAQSPMVLIRGTRFNIWLHAPGTLHWAITIFSLAGVVVLIDRFCWPTERFIKRAACTIGRATGILLALVLLLTLGGCSTQTASTPSLPPVVEAPKHAKRVLPTSADILAAQAADVQQIIKHHQAGARWPTVRHGATVLYPYGADDTPVVNSAPLHTTDIALEPGETITDVAMGDAQRWMAMPASAGDPRNPNPHLVVKPEIGGIETSLTIYTTRRLYHIELRTRGHAMQEVEFYYPDDVLQSMAEADREARQTASADDAAESATPSALPDVDPSRLNFSYKIGGPRLPWTPRRVFDDGSRVFIEMPASMQTSLAPALMVDAAGGQQMVNYRVVADGSNDGGSYFVVDRLFDKAELVSGVGRDQDRVLVTYSGAAR